MHGGSAENDKRHNHAGGCSQHMFLHRRDGRAARRLDRTVRQGLALRLLLSTALIRYPGGRTSRLSGAFRHDWNCFGTRGRTTARVRFAFQPLQVGSYFGCTLMAQVAIFLQRLVDDAFQLSGNVRVQAHCRCGLGLQNRFEEARCCPAEGEQQVNENGPSRSKPTGRRLLRPTFRSAL
jgi:hypothetical protein